MPTLKEKVKDVFQNRIGENFDRKEIIDLVVNKYAETNPESVIPSDYCYNMSMLGLTLGLTSQKICTYLNLSEKDDTSAWGVDIVIPELFIGKEEKLANGGMEI
ncbi:MAG: hypothetical protein ABSA09_08410 [Desulfobaccales bacterium]|jgi:hypothetical protein